MGCLRTILAITVVLAHSPWNDGVAFAGGRNAVQLFYVISGFLIAHVIRTNPAYRSPSRFYINRALRLYPIYFVVLLLTLLVTVLKNLRYFDLYAQIPAGAVVWLIVANVFLFGQDWIMFAGIESGHVVFTADFRLSEIPLYKGLLIPQAWTLGVELSFYLLAPFLLRSKAAVFLSIVLSLAVRVGLLASGWGLKDPWIYRFFPAELSLFLFGSLSNWYLLPIWEKAVSGKVLNWLPAVATGLLLLSILAFSWIPQEEFTKSLILFAIFIPLLPLTFLFQNTSRCDKIIGELSYPIYIGHVLVVMLLAEVMRKSGLQPRPLTVSAINVACSCVFAYVLNITVARRIELIRARVKSDKVENGAKGSNVCNVPNASESTCHRES